MCKDQEEARGLECGDQEYRRQTERVLSAGQKWGLHSDCNKQGRDVCDIEF